MKDEFAPKTHLYQGAIRRDKVTHYRCSDCGMAYDVLKKNSMRPNNKFCDIDCMAYVLENGMQPYGSRPRGFKKWLEEIKED